MKSRILVLGVGALAALGALTLFTLQAERPEAVTDVAPTTVMEPTAEAKDVGLMEWPDGPHSYAKQSSTSVSEDIDAGPAATVSRTRTSAAPTLVHTSTRSGSKHQPQATYQARLIFQRVLRQSGQGWPYPIMPDHSYPVVYPPTTTTETYPPSGTSYCLTMRCGFLGAERCGGTPAPCPTP